MNQTKMEYRQIVAVTGLGGLYHLMGTKKDGAIVKSLSDDTMKFISARTHHLTPLESIEIYTTDENVRLHQVFERIQAQDEAVEGIVAQKNDPAARDYFKQILPNYDAERVYMSDIKKILKWYLVLKERDLLHFEYLKPAEEGEAAEHETVEAQEKTEDA